MEDKIKEVFARQVDLIKLSEKEQEKIEKETESFVKELENKIKKKRIKAEVFVGGSLAKGTIIKKQNYDIDIFVRFDKKYQDNEISNMLHKLMSNMKVKRIHGSRDYFQIKRKSILFEIVPTIKIAKPTEAKNVTDLSFFHVNYIKNQIRKNKRLAGEIMLAKSFCHAQNCYGAESYILGFSGYALELLVSYYKSLLGFIKAVKERRDKQQIILDPEKFYKNKQEILLNLNEAKLHSPIVFVDPTFKERNVLAALSSETFNKFKTACTQFLKSPSKKFFEKQNLQEKLRKRYKNLIIIDAKTNKQKGDIAGSKLKKFYEFLMKKIEKNYIIKIKEFEYDESKNTGKIYLILKQKKALVIAGPPITKVENLMSFKKKHKNCYIKQGKAYAREKPKNIKETINELRKDKILKEMDITEVKLFQ